MRILLMMLLLAWTAFWLILVCNLYASTDDDCACATYIDGKLTVVPCDKNSNCIETPDGSGSVTWSTEHEESSRDVGRSLCQLAKHANSVMQQAILDLIARPQFDADLYCTTLCGMDNVFCQNSCVDCLGDYTFGTPTYVNPIN